MLIRRAEIDGRVCDVRIGNGRIQAIGCDLGGDGPVLDAHGGALIPGLHDHHLHLFALAAAMRSVACGPPDVRDASALAKRLRALPSAASTDADADAGWIRGTGYHESVAGELSRDVLDRFVARRPLRIQHRSGAAWFLNSAALEAIGLAPDAHPTAGSDAARAAPGALPEGVERDADGRPTGRLFGCDAWLRSRLPASAPPELAAAGQRLARLGVTGVTDATPGNGARELERFRAARASGALPQALHVMGGEALPDGGDPELRRGPLKILLRETALPHPSELARRIARSHRADRAVAIHCVTRSELIVAASALGEAGVAAGDRIEHASIAPPEAVALLAELGVSVVTQPNFLRERGDAYRSDVDARDRPWLYRCRGFLEAGVALGGGTDAPFGDPDPWRAMQAAVDRKSAGGAVLDAGEALSPERALALFTSDAAAPGGPARRAVPGAPADLCLLRLPWKQFRDRLDAADVVATLRSGIVIGRPAPL